GIPTVYSIGIVQAGSVVAASATRQNSTRVRYEPGGLVKTQHRLLVAAIAVLVAFVTSIQPASAWNDRGHMSVAYIAYKKLNPAMRDRVNALLNLKPKYNGWAAKVDQQMPSASLDDMNW